MVRVGMDGDVKGIQSVKVLLQLFPVVQFWRTGLMWSNFGLPLITCVRCHVRTTASETEALALPVRKFGTVCHVACEHLTSATNILKHY